MEFQPKEINFHCRKKRFHSKSKGGCVQCKQYRTKCDEVKPSCSRCAKKKLQCRYATQDAASPDSLIASRSSSTPSLGVSDTVSSLSHHDVASHETQRDDRDKSSQRLGVSVEARSRQPSPLLPSTDARHDLRLSLPRAYTDLLGYWQHHATRIFELPTTSHLARTLFVDVALEKPFLLHALLACGAVLKALSLPYQSPAFTEAVLEASEHETASMNMFRSTITKVDESNYEAVFMYTLIAALFVYTSFHPRLHDDVEERLHQLTSSNWIRTLRAIPDVMGDECWPWLRLSPLVVFTYPGAFEEVVSAPKDPFFQSMRAKCLELSKLWDVDEQEVTQAQSAEHNYAVPRTIGTTQLRPVLSVADIETYRACHIILLETLGRVAMASSPIPSSTSTDTLPTIVACAAWPVLVPPSFPDCLDRKTPQALLLLAHWGVLMNRVSGVYWVEGFGGSVIGAVAQEFVKRDEECLAQGTQWHNDVDWKGWMEWPLRMVGRRLLER